MTDAMLLDDSTANVYVRRQDDNPGVTKGWPSSMILVRPNATGPSSRPRRPKGRLDARLGLVRRETSFALLSAVSAGGVALLCAPAGSGKSVLVGSWAETEGFDNRVAWVSVERAERDEQRFWSSVTDALAGVDGVVGRVVPGQRFCGHGLVDRLLSQLNALEEPAVLVIDDLHEISARSVTHRREIHSDQAAA
jgi:ATP/maltotriose-dependent transcriptional regulator MalT